MEANVTLKMTNNDTRIGYVIRKISSKDVFSLYAPMTRVGIYNVYGTTSLIGGISTIYTFDPSIDFTDSDGNFHYRNVFKGVGYDVFNFKYGTYEK